MTTYKKFTYREAVDRMIQARLYPSNDIVFPETLQYLVDVLTPDLPYVAGRIEVVHETEYVPEPNYQTLSVFDVSAEKVEREDSFRFYNCQLIYYDDRLLSVQKMCEVLTRFNDRELKYSSMYQAEEFMNKLKTNFPYDDKDMQPCVGCDRKWSHFNLKPEDQCQPENIMQVKLTGSPCNRYRGLIVEV